VLTRDSIISNLPAYTSQSYRRCYVLYSLCPALSPFSLSFGLLITKQSRSDSTKTKANVVNGNGIKHDVSIRTELSVHDQVKLKHSFDQLLRGITENQNTAEMGLGRLEFGYPFKAVRWPSSLPRWPAYMHRGLPSCMKLQPYC